MGPFPGVDGMVWKFCPFGIIPFFASSLIPNRWKVAYGEISSSCPGIEPPAEKKILALNIELMII